MAKKPLTPQQRAEFEKQEAVAEKIFCALEDEIPSDFGDVMMTLEDKRLRKELRDACKTASIDCNAFVNHVDEACHAWTALQKAMSAVLKTTDKSHKAARKALGKG